MAAQLRPRPRIRSAGASVIKVVLTGSESTGKTELARELAAHFRAPVSVKYVREYAEAHDGKIEFADHGPIARGQMEAEDAAIGRAKNLVILDTDLVSTVVYCRHYFGSCPPWIEREAHARAGDLYLLMKPDIPWQPDGVRDRPDTAQRDEIHQLFRRKLDELRLEYVEIGGTRAQRRAAAIGAVERAGR
jgi:NadR type nicotinamide-nucleotide adenylyltransferase